MAETRTEAPVDLVIRGGKIAMAGHITSAWIAVDGGKIVTLGSNESWPEAKRTINARGKYVLPGIIDNELHPTPPATGTFVTDEPQTEVVFTETRAALISGITTHGIQMGTLSMNKSLRDSDTILFARDEMPTMTEAFPRFLEVMARSMTDYFLTPFIQNDKQAKEIPEFAEKHGVTSYKIYLQCMGGEHLWDMWPVMKWLGMYYFDDGMIYIVMKNVAALGPPAVLGFHCENWEIARVIKEELLAQGRSDVAAWDDKSPHFTEAGHVRTYAYYAKATGCPIYIQHTTTPESVEEILKARAEGVKIWGNTSPHYLTLTKDVWRTNVPLRSREAIDKCWEALRTGGIDVVSSDHCCTDIRPVEEVEKTGRQYKKDVLTQWDGMGGRAEALLPIMLSEGVNKGRISLERLVEVCCENPARKFGLYPKKGVIAVGSDADFVIVDLNKTKTLTRDMLYNRMGWSIWEDWEIKGWPVMTILRGNVMMEWPDGKTRAKIVGKPVGQYIPRKPGHELYPLD